MGEHQLIVTHGNGPQVGMLAVESASDPNLERPYPFDALGAETQGVIGYWLAQALGNALAPREVVALVTQTVVDPHDRAFANPTKFIGRQYDKDEALRVGEQSEWTMREDGGRWRRVVASPEPREVVERATIDRLVREGTVVVCAGGGGVPVVRERSGELAGVEAVIDKDLATSLLATGVRADRLLFLTDVERVYANYATANQRPLARVGVKELRGLSFPAGSMGPKVEAACRFVEASGNVASIGSLDDVEGLLAATSGTQVVATRPRE